MTGENLRGRPVEPADDSTARSCNTGCPAYVNGTCNFIETIFPGDPVELYGYKDRRDCSRYRDKYPERI